MIKHYIAPFICTQMQKQLSMKVTLVMYLNQSIILLYQIYKNLSSRLIIDSFIDHNINISKYNPLADSSYIKFAKELDNPRKGLINNQNINHNECLKWCLVRYFHPPENRKTDKDISKKLGFKDI